MKSPLFLIVTNRGVFKAGWIVPYLPESQSGFEPCHTDRPPQIHWIRELALVKARQHLSEQLSDMAGAFAATASGGSKPLQLGSSPSETHWRIEAERRTVADLAEHIRGVLLAEKPERWALAVPADMHGELLERLSETCRDHLVRVIPKNLGEAPAAVLLKHVWNDSAASAEPTGARDSLDIPAPSAAKRV
jgi:hypothetical protein